MRLPIRTKLTLVFAALMVVVLGIAGMIVYRTFASQLDLVTDARLAALAKELAADIESGEAIVLQDFGGGDSEGFFGQVLNADGSIAEKQNVAPTPLLSPLDLGLAKDGRYFEKFIKVENETIGRPVRLAVEATVADRFVIVGTSLSSRNTELHQLAKLLWIAGPLLGLAASALAWLLSGAALRPVENLRQQVSLISDNDLSKRLPVLENGDEIATLAKTLNDMLQRLEQAFERERRFVDDASHELRTPLGILKTELDLALRRSRTKEELQAALLSASEESERLNRIAEDLLVLARTDRGKLPLKRETANAQLLLHRSVARFETKAKTQNVQVEVSTPPDLAIDVDPLRLQQVLGNLIINALANVARGGRIDVSAQLNGAHELVLTVADNGPGFPPAFIESAFDPFTRGDSGRSRRNGGTGLGLAIVKGVAEAHGGTASAENRSEGGAIVTLRIPQ